jgi:hypothetical protein
MYIFDPSNGLYCTALVLILHSGESVMELMFRGSRYSYEPSHGKGVQKPLAGCYRGQLFEWMIRSTPALSWREEMCYRGVAYGGSSTRQVSVKTEQSVVDNVQSLHRYYILQRLQQRLISAKAKGDQQLVQALELEMKLST